MRRGFKSWCERTAVEYRQALGLPVTAALDPRRLAALLQVQVAIPEDLPTLPPASLTQLTVTDAGSWSAVTVSQGNARLVILNSGQSPARQANSLAHELAHIILNHVSEQVQLSHEGFLLRTTFDRAQEEEANWLAGCLLVPREALLHACRRNHLPSALAAHFGVSEDLIAWRLRMTGIRKQLGRAVSSAA